jgi:hypothetical protein
LSEQCSYDVELADGSSVSQLVAQSVTCEASSDGRAICRCSEEGRPFSFDYPWVGASAQTCEETLELCLKKDEYELEDTYQCERSTEVLREEDCETTFSCLQPAMIGGVSVDLRGTLRLRCTEAGGEWSCQCSSQNTDGRVRNEAEVAVAAVDNAACGAAEAACLEAVDVVFADGR